MHIFFSSFFMSIIGLEPWLYTQNDMSDINEINDIKHLSNRTIIEVTNIITNCILTREHTVLTCLHHLSNLLICSKPLTLLCFNKLFFSFFSIYFLFLMLCECSLLSPSTLHAVNGECIANNVLQLILKMKNKEEKLYIENY